MERAAVSSGFSPVTQSHLTAVRQYKALGRWSLLSSGSAKTKNDVAAGDWEKKRIHLRPIDNLEQ